MAHARFTQPGEQFQQSGFTRTVRPDNAQGLAALNIEADTVEQLGTAHFEAHTRTTQNRVHRADLRPTRISANTGAPTSAVITPTGIT